MANNWLAFEVQLVAAQSRRICARKLRGPNCSSMTPLRIVAFFCTCPMFVLLGAEMGGSLLQLVFFERDGGALSEATLDRRVS